MKTPQDPLQRELNPNTPTRQPCYGPKVAQGGEFRRCQRISQPYCPILVGALLNFHAIALRRIYEVGICNGTIDRQTLINLRADHDRVRGPFALPFSVRSYRSYDHHRPALVVGKRRRQPETMGQTVPEFIQIAGLVQSNWYAVYRIATEQHMHVISRSPEVSVGDPNQLIHRRAEVAQRRWKGRSPRTCGQLQSPWGRYG